MYITSTIINHIHHQALEAITAELKQHFQGVAGELSELSFFCRNLWLVTVITDIT